MLRAAGIGAGDDVVVSAFGNPEVARAVALAGARPVFADIDESSYCLDPAAVEAQVGPRTAGVVAVHRFGHRADLTRLHSIGRRHGLLVLEHLEHAEDEVGDEVRQRRVHAAYLDRRLSGVLTPLPSDGHSYAQYVVRIPGNGRPDRDAFARTIRARGVECRVPVKTPLHRTPEFLRQVALPRTERAADETLALAVDASMGRRDLQRTVSACNALGGLLMPA
ncbi:DegT/DnrJ/EryC1/StrS family aminotransferase [Streptomyces sp. NA04227]|uniref:DegT/DnrJ/EryC1/StrS family aminotransferase n=1 Tax=Streptomyces sp. NA04227 TaxID=2742136 RepID=UPI00159041E1|nr:DegT/DnrJ/EryC1/StrS family aminotransferase [Streptomyces sp. NA04227]QKW09533.1 DegT/DnrJ/EryC1/StrS family aminotransferase [Streptomyces sp. NA04227]